MPAAEPDTAAVPADPALTDPALLDSAGFALWRQASDIRIRTRLGGAYYLMAWLLCWGFSADPRGSWLEGLGLTSLFAGLLALRVVHRLPRSPDVARLERWLHRHWLLVLLTACAWGLVTAWMLWAPQFGSSRLIALVASVAFATAMAFTFPMDRPRVLLALALLSLPALVVLCLDIGQQLSLVLTLLAYLSFLLLVLKRGHGEYHAHLAMEIELREQRERFRTLSQTDPLTGLSNRLQLHAVLPLLLAGARRQGTPLSLLLFDIDFFKSVNDRFGHAAGDACLVAFAEQLRALFRRDSDLVVRLGGEEFAVLMPEAPAAEAARLADAFCLQIAAAPVDWRGQQIALTVSAGVGSLDPQQDHDADALMQRVDRALYRAKREGRNRVVLADG